MGRTLRKLVQAALIRLDRAAQSLEHVPAILRIAQLTSAIVAGCAVCPIQQAVQRAANEYPRLKVGLLLKADMLASASCLPGLTRKCSACDHRESSHFRHSVPSCSGSGDMAPYASV